MNQQSLPLAQKTRRSLTGKEAFALAAFTLAEYTKANLPDSAFAEKASAFLGIEGLNDNHILSARKVNDIPATRFVRAKEKAETKLSKKDEELSDRILSLEKQVRKLFAMADEGKKDVSYQHAEPGNPDELLPIWRKTLRTYAPTHPTPAEVPTWIFQFALAILRGEWQ